MTIDRSIADRLQTQHLALLNIIADLSDERLVCKPVSGKWSIKDNIAHLAKYQLVFIDRLNKICTAQNPTFPSYKAEEDKEFPEWQNMDLLFLVENIKVNRNKIIDILAKQSSTDLKNIGLHSTYGQLNLLEWTEFFLLHEARHLYTIFQLVHSSENRHFK